jgi:hypothetical protein
MNRSIFRIFACTALLAGAGTASAGVLDSPVPLLGGQKTSIAYAVTGVINGAGLGTLFSCTNTSSAAMMVSVDLFVDAGGAPCNDSSAVAVTIDPGATKMFSTQNNVQSSFFSTVPLTAVDMFLALGSARIIATGKGLICSGMVADVYNSPPTSMIPLVMAARGKHKGD